MALTTEQRNKIDEAIAPLKADAMRTDPIDRDACVAAFNAVYVAQNLPPPEYAFFGNPMDALQQAEKMAASKWWGYRRVLGGEADASFNHVCNQVFTPFLLQPVWNALASRADKQTDPFNDLYNVVESTLSGDKVELFGKSMLYYGNHSFWSALGELARVEAFVAIGLAQRPELCALARRALASCNQSFAYERYCFISERPEKFHHPAFSKDGPRDRITIQWRDGYACDEELWY